MGCRSVAVVLFTESSFDPTDGEELLLADFRGGKDITGLGAVEVLFIEEINRRFAVVLGLFTELIGF